MLIFDDCFRGIFWDFSNDIAYALPAILTCGLELAMLSVTGLLAIWAGLGRPHWFVRAVVVLAGLSLWLVVPAYEPMLIFFTQTAVAAPLLSWARSRRARTQSVAIRRGAVVPK